MSKVPRSSPYDFVNERLGRTESSRIDDAVEERLGLGKLNRRIARASQAIFDSLADEGARPRWFEWERLTGTRAIERDQVLFDLAYEFGVHDALAEQLPRDADEEGARVAARLRSEIGLTKLSPARRVVALLHVALSIVHARSPIGEHPAPCCLTDLGGALASGRPRRRLECRSG